MTTCYEIQQSSNKVTVIRDAVKVLRVEQKYLWTGAILCKVFEGDKLVLEYTFNDSLFGTKIKILDSLLEPFELLQRNGSYLMEFKGHVFSRHWKFGRRHTFLYQDNFEAGYLESGFQVRPPFTFQLIMHGISEHEYYIIIYYLLTMSPS